MSVPCWFRAGAAFLAAFLAGCASISPSQLSRFEYSQPQMGLLFRVVLYAPDQPTAEAAAQGAFARIKQLNDILSDYEYDSELSQLSRTAGEGREVQVSRELWTVLEFAQRISERSDGAFDVTVGPCVSLWRKARREKKLPDPARLEEARQGVGWKNLVLDPKQRTARLLVPGMRLDLGAIAKGFACDEALKALRVHGVTRALVSGGGDMAAGDPPPGQSGWHIELAPLDAPDAPPKRFVRIANCGLATSGDLFQHVEIEGRRYSHILNPRTGIGLTDHSLVTVIAPSGMAADALSTAVSVLGPETGLKLVEATSGAAAHIIRKPGQKIETAESSRFGRFYERP
jgi:thiamine biosynthesis lipoprotein